ncbi:MAG TPA: type II secretion system protein [Steroidobacteraceae bacterium]|nr:type II secretion system protein [Steroidobacteraceae bacterium]
MHMATRAASGIGRPFSGGFTYVGLLFAVTILGFALAMSGEVYRTSARRDRESQLLWVGGQYQQALRSYYLNGPLGLHQFPASLEDLLEDRRGPTLTRHLRRLYPDPMTGLVDWNLERAADGSIIGVRSKAVGRPFKQAGFAAEQESFASAECYCDWGFIYMPHQRQLTEPATL